MDRASMKDVSKNMRLTGMLLFKRAFLEALETTSSICVVHMAQSAEILLKARIADEHPLLIFSKIPSQSSTQSRLSLKELLEKGHTFSYAQLPDQLWATTGTRIETLEGYKAFGRLRNQIIHFSMANEKELDLQALEYAVDILDPLVTSFWGKSVLDFFQADPWFDPVWARWLELPKRDRIFEKFERIPKIRILLGDGAVDDWTLYKDELKTEAASLAEEHKSISEAYATEESRMQDKWMEEERKDRESKWQSFLDSFTSV